ncbi:MAG: hypothetical protein ACI4LC_02235 [Emergencia sp.]
MGNKKKSWLDILIQSQASKVKARSERENKKDSNKRAGKGRVVNAPKNDGKKTQQKTDTKSKGRAVNAPKNDGKKTTKVNPPVKNTKSSTNTKNERPAAWEVREQRKANTHKNYNSNGRGNNDSKGNKKVASDATKKKSVSLLENNGYIGKGALKDGISPLNVAKTIVGSYNDFTEDIFKGVGGLGETLIDAGANFAAGITKKLGYDDTYKSITNFIQRDLAGEFNTIDQQFSSFFPQYNLIKNANKILNGGVSEDSSILNYKADSIVQSGGQLAGAMALQTVGVPWQVSMGLSAYTSGTEEAYANGASWEDAQIYGTVTGASEILSEYISGGLKLGGRTLDEGVKRALTDKIKNNVARTFAKYGFDAVGEAGEEVVSQLGQNLGKKLSYESDKSWEEIFLSDEARQEYVDSFVGGFILPMVTNAGRVKTSVTTGRDYDSNLSTNEINIVNNETQKRVNEAKKKKAVSDEITRRIDEANNLLGNVSEKRRSEIEKAVNKEYDEGKDYTETELSKKELNTIEDEVLKDLNLGKIDIDTIEEYFEPEKVRRINEINRTIDNAENKEALLEERNRLRTEIAESMKERLREDYVLQESYRQKNLANEKFSTKVSKKESEITKKLRESMEASGADNTRDTHNLYSILNKYGNDTGTEVVVVNSEQMREIGFGGQNSEGKNLVVQGMHKVIDGKHKLIINKDSDQALRIIAGHEITHGLEEANAYNDLQEAVFAYAKTKGDYDTVRKEFEQIYDGITDDIDGEVTSELVGRYLFEDDAFINQLSTEKPGLIKQILEKVKRLLNMVTAGSKEARELERVKQRFEDAYREVGKNTNQSNEQYSLQDLGPIKKRENSFEEHKYYKNIIHNYKDMNPSGFTVVGKLNENSALSEIGMPAGRVIFDNGKIIKELEGRIDPLPSDIVAEIPKVLNNPVVITKAPMNNTVNVLGYLFKDEKPILVGVMIGKDRSGASTISKIRTTHMRKVLTNIIRDDNVMYLNENKKNTKQWFHACGTEVPLGETKFGVIRTLADFKENVNGKMQLSIREESNKKSLNQVIVRDYAAELQSEYDTTFNPYNDIKELYDFMDSVDGKLRAEDLQEAESMASSIADDILLNMKASQTLTEEASDILKELRGAKITLSDNQKSEVTTAYDGYGRYIQSLFGSVRISKNGVPLDEQWQYWSDSYPNLFDRGTPDSEQPIRLAEIIEQLRNSFEVADLPNKNDIELKILSDFYDYPGMRYDKSEATFADAESSVQRKFKGEEVIDEPLRTGDVIDEEIALTESMLQDNIEKGNHILSKALERKLRDLRRERKRSIPSRKEIHKAYVDEIANEFKANGMDFNKVLEDAKDKSTFSSVDNTPQRFIEKTLGYKEGQIFNKMTMSKLGKNEADGIRWLNSITGSNGLLATLYDKYQIKPASKESAAAQKYAEGRYVNDYGDYVEYGDEELAREFKDTKTQERIRGLATDPLIREFYDNTFDRINESRARNGYEPIPKRQNYFLHFIEDRGLLSRIGFPLNPNNRKAKDLPTDINGMTADNKPGQPYFASAQQRKGIRTTYDILGGIEKYANAAKNQIYHIDDIQRFRAVRNYLADMFGQANGLDDLELLEPEKQKERIKEVFDGHLSNFAKFLNEEANIIAGKTPLIDRGLEGVVGRRALAFMKTLNSQVGSNMVGMNVGSSLTNMVSVVQAVLKSSKADAIKSFTQMCLNTIVKTDDLMEQSDFWIRRQGSEQFYKNPWQKAQDLGYTLMTITDNFATEFIIRTKYNEFKRKGYDNPLQKADEWAARLLADRSLGQMPQLYNSKALGLITKFQLEVRNQLDSMWYDTINEAKETSNNTLVRTAKITSTVVQLAVLQHLFGKAFEAVAGYNPAFDIVSVLMTAFGPGDDDDDKEPMDRIEEAFLELLEDLPYTSTLKGGRIPMASALPVNELATGQNQYGQDISRLETLKAAAPYYFLPAGYGQIKKTIKGMKMFDKDNPVPGQYNKSGKLQYPVEDTVMNRIQAGIFGANANKNAREYYDGEHKPLTDKQLEEYQELNIPISGYWKYRKGLSEAGDKNDDKIKYINELNFPLEKKAIMMNNLYNKKEDAEKWYATKPAIYSVLGDNYAEAVRKLNTFKADKDEDGKTISGSKKEKVIDYLNKSDFDYAEKLIIFESEGYKLTDDEHLEVIDYLNNREDVSYEQMEDILKALGYEVDEEGNVRW